MKEIISAPARPKAHYNNAVLAEGRILFIATQPSVDWETGQFLDGDIYFQAQKALENVVFFLKKAGATLDNVVKTGIFLADINDFDAMNEFTTAFFRIPKRHPSVLRCKRHFRTSASKLNLKRRPFFRFKRGYFPPVTTTPL